MSKKNLLIAVLAVVIILAIALLTLEFGQDFFNQPKPIVDNQPNKPAKQKLELIEKKIEKEEKPYHVAITYPQFTGQDELNKKINDFIQKQLSDFETTAKESDEIKNEINVEAGEEKILWEYYLNISYEKGQIDSDFVSLVFKVDYFTGGAHGNQFYQAINLNLKKQQEVKLADLFSEHPDYLKSISQYCLQDLSNQIKERMEGYEPDSEMIKEGAGEKEENFSNFLFDGDNVIFYFSPYQVAPYALGDFKVVMSRNINEQFGLANPAAQNCLKNKGRLEIIDGPLGQYGICYFEDNRQCEEWAMLRGDCPVGGVKVTGFTSPATVYCAITGHEAIEGQNENEGICIVNNVICLAKIYYETGKCTDK